MRSAIEMITVMSPSGVRATYNDANCVEFYPDRREILYKDEKGLRFYRAIVPAGSDWLIEWKKPCEVTAPPMPSAEVALDMLLQHIESGHIQQASCWKLKDLKRALSKFNARRGTWR